MKLVQPYCTKALNSPQFVERQIRNLEKMGRIKQMRREKDEIARGHKREQKESERGH